MQTVITLTQHLQNGSFSTPDALTPRPRPSTRYNSPSSSSELCVYHENMVIAPEIATRLASLTTYMGASHKTPLRDRKTRAQS